MPRLLAIGALVMVAVGYFTVYKTHQTPGNAPNEVFVTEIHATDFPGTVAPLVLIGVAALLVLVLDLRTGGGPKLKGAAVLLAILACAFQVLPVMDWFSRIITPGLGLYAQVAGSVCVFVAALLVKD